MSFYFFEWAMMTIHRPCAQYPFPTSFTVETNDVTNFDKEQGRHTNLRAKSSTIYHPRSVFRLELLEVEPFVIRRVESGVIRLRVDK